MDAHTLLLDSLHTRWDKYKSELKTCRLEFSEAAVHDFRVAARRLLASLDLLRAVIRDPRIQKTRRSTILMICAISRHCLPICPK
jgi:CHAD domain-containing protein